MNSLSFSSSFIKNTEPIEQNLNGRFMNKHDKIQFKVGNFEKLQEIITSLISFFALLRIFVYVQSRS
jgi:hypothetical protein